RATDSARAALDIAGTFDTGWLRFDGSRLDEELGACYVQLGCPDKAEPLLLSVLDRPLSTRRRASVLVDLAAAAALRRDPLQLVTYGNAALDIARRTHSGYLGRRLELLRRHIKPVQRDQHVHHLSQQITALQLR
ncbi:transcriptional regulator, partial [Streptomyces lydicus]